MLQVLAANEAVFASIGATFSSLATALLPAYQLRLRKVRTLALSWRMTCLVWLLLETVTMEPDTVLPCCYAGGG